MRSVQLSSYELPDKPAKPGQLPVANWARVSDGYFEAMHSRLLKGRAFSRAQVVTGQLVVVVNEAFARANWPGQDPVGRILIVNGEDGKPAHYSVIGVVGDERQMGRMQGAMRNSICRASNSTRPS